MPGLRKNIYGGKSVQGKGISADKAMCGVDISAFEISDYNIGYCKDHWYPLEHGQKAGEDAHGIRHKEMGSGSTKIDVQTLLSGC